MALASTSGLIPSSGPARNSIIGSTIWCVSESAFITYRMQASAKKTLAWNWPPSSSRCRCAEPGVERPKMPIGRYLNVTPPRLAPVTRAALWILLSGICAVMMNVLIRIAAQAMHPFEVAFFRCLFGLVFILPWIIKGGPGLLRTRNAGFYLLRAAVGLVSMATWFYGITVVPLATATAVNFTAPLFATLAAALVLHEDVRLRRWSAVVIGFIGVLVIMRPGSSPLDANLLLLLLSAATGAMNNITVKFLVRTEPPNKIVALFMLYLTPLSLVPALFVWQWPSLSGVGALIGLGCLGTVAHLSVARALAAADA